MNTNEALNHRPTQSSPTQALTAVDRALLGAFLRLARKQQLPTQEMLADRVAADPALVASGLRKLEAEGLLYRQDPKAAFRLSMMGFACAVALGARTRKPTARNHRRPAQVLTLTSASVRAA
jgi:DNA-binding Lrp family transcriptional regulator